MKFKNLLAQSLVWRSVYYISLLFLNIAISRHLQAAGSGDLFYLTNFFYFFQLLLSLTLENALTYFGASGKIDIPSLFWFSLLWCGLISILLFALSFTGWVFYQKYFVYAFAYIAGLSLVNFISAFFICNAIFICQAYCLHCLT